MPFRTPSLGRRFVTCQSISRLLGPYGHQESLERSHQLSLCRTPLSSFSPPDPMHGNREKQTKTKNNERQPVCDNRALLELNQTCRYIHPKRFMSEIQSRQRTGDRHSETETERKGDEVVQDHGPLVTGPTGFAGVQGTIRGSPG